MLLNNFFKISKQQQECDHTVFTIELIVNHPIYTGHFPERPIVPGVCSIEIIKECTAVIMQNPLQFIALEQSKFFNPIKPLQHKKLKVSIKIKALNKVEYLLTGDIKDTQTTFVSIKSKIKTKI
ncbi:MAG: (3R)-hydroxymyristoyl-ACP dehydratase [Bacteroidetes bacterium ADurb.Bin234]|jgi:3-hydroxyacyl-[acyl-carrier-protein] dehydratase|nr:MAG: (3R)-hydroxymyristoyl-ACP dehydratase [Bacteroidetes bacterium ADurb.Bin234]